MAVGASEDLPASTDGGHTYAVLVGISNYTQYPVLQSPVNDATSLRSALTDVRGCGLPTDHVRLIPEAEATHTRILDEIKTIAAKAQKQDRVFIYFAGHGIKMDNDFGLAASDTSADADGHAPLTGAEIGDALSITNAYGILFIIDCCYGANFTEFAPRFFRNRGDSNYRVLLSSTRANQQSWEVAEGGSTLFSKYLCKCIDGSAAVSFVQGAIFLSDLERYIADNVAADLKKISKQFHQEQTVLDARGRDPLVFKQAKLTDSKISFLIAQFSKRDIIEYATFMLSAIAFLIVTLFMVQYSILERSRFAKGSNAWIEIDQGHVGLNAYGFPIPRYQTDVEQDGALSGSPLRRNQGTVNAPIEAPMLPALLGELDQTSRLEIDYWSGNLARVHEGLKNAWTKGGRLIGASYLLEAATSKEDLSWLGDVIRDATNTDDRVFASIAATHLDPDGHLSGFAHSGVPPGYPHDFPLRLLSMEASTCSGAMDRYITDLLTGENPENYRSAAVEAALRFHCRVSFETLGHVLTNSFGLFAAQDLAGFIDAHQASSGQFLALVSKIARMDPPRYQLPILSLAILASAATAPCDEQLLPQLAAPDSDMQAFAAAALLRHCGLPIREKVRSLAPRTPKTIAVLATYDAVSADEVRSRLQARDLDTFDAAYLLTALGHVGSRDDIALIKGFMDRRPHDENGTRVAGLIALKHLKASAGDALPYRYDMGDPGKYAIDLIVSADPLAAKKALFEDLQRGNTYIQPYVKYAKKIPISREEADLLKQKLAEPDSGSIGAFLVQIVCRRDLLQILESPDRETRDQASKWAALNDNFDDALVDTVAFPYPSAEGPALRRTLAQKKMIMRVLDGLPSAQRPWRSKLLAESWRPQFVPALMEKLDSYQSIDPLRDFWVVRDVLP